MELVQIEENPMPKNPIMGMCETNDGVNLRHAVWRNKNSPTKGTVILFGGRAEYIEKNYETISDLLENGFDVLAFDWRGQGGSSRLVGNKRLGFVDNFSHYVTDAETIFTSVALPDCRAPYFILGHSTGSLVALLSAPTLGPQIKRMVLGSPMLGLVNLPFSQNIVKYITGFLHIIGLGRFFVAGGPNPQSTVTLEKSEVTSSKTRFSKVKKFAEKFPNITIGGPSASWIFSAIRAIEDANDPDFAPQVTVPTLLICAGNEHVVDNNVTEHFGRKLRSGKSLTIAGAKHEILQEQDIYREQFLAAFYAFVPGGDKSEDQNRNKSGAKRSDEKDANFNEHNNEKSGIKEAS